MRAERHGRQRVVERTDVPKLHASVVGGGGIGQVGGRDHPALVIEDVAQGAGAYLALAKVRAKTAERDVGRRDAQQLAIGIERRGDGNADQGLRGKDVGIGDDGRARLFGGAIPGPHARVVGRVLIDAGQFLLAAVEKDVMIDAGRSGFRQKPSIGIGGALRRQLVVDRSRRVDAPRLPQGAVVEADIDADDLRAVQQDAVEVFQAAVVEVEAVILLAQRRRGPDQRFERIESVLDALERIDAKTLDQFLGVRPRNAVVREICDRDDGEKDGNGEKEERRQDAGLEPKIVPEDVSHGRAVLGHDSQYIIGDSGSTHAVAAAKAADASNASRWPAGRRGPRRGCPPRRRRGRRSGSRPEPRRT